jgi:hypothetical protein
MDPGAATAAPTGPADRRPITAPPPDSEVAQAITGRAYQASGFWAFAVPLTALVLVVPVLLMTWGVISGLPDGAQAKQVAWGIALALVGLAGVGFVAASGTTMNEKGLKRMRVQEPRRP